jgi:hypothetical protein
LGGKAAQDRPIAARRQAASAADLAARPLWAVGRGARSHRVLVGSSACGTDTSSSEKSRKLKMGRAAAFEAEAAKFNLLAHFVEPPLIAAPPSAPPLFLPPVSYRPAAIFPSFFIIRFPRVLVLFSARSSGVVPRNRAHPHPPFSGIVPAARLCASQPSRITAQERAPRSTGCPISPLSDPHYPPQQRRFAQNLAVAVSLFPAISVSHFLPKATTPLQSVALQRTPNPLCPENHHVHSRFFWTSQLHHPKLARNRAHKKGWKAHPRPTSRQHINREQCSTRGCGGQGLSKKFSERIQKCQPERQPHCRCPYHPSG